MLRAVFVAVAVTAAVVSAGRVKVVPPGFYDLAKAHIDNPGCTTAADSAFAVLTGNKEYISYKIAHTKIEDFPKYELSEPGKTLCNGKDRVMFLSMSVAPKNDARVAHHALLHIYGGGKYAMLYQSYSNQQHKSDEDKTYNMAEYIKTLDDGWFKTGKDGDLGNLPPVLKQLPCECADMAGWLQHMLELESAKGLKAEYNRMFTPQNDKQNVKSGTFWGFKSGEKDYFHLYVFHEGVPLAHLKSAFIEAAAVHYTQQRVKSPASLIGLKRARKHRGAAHARANANANALQH